MRAEAIAAAAGTAAGTAAGVVGAAGRGTGVPPLAAARARAGAHGPRQKRTRTTRWKHAGLVRCLHALEACVGSVCWMRALEGCFGGMQGLKGDCVYSPTYRHRRTYVKSVHQEHVLEACRACEVLVHIGCVRWKCAWPIGCTCCVCWKHAGPVGCLRALEACGGGVHWKRAGPIRCLCALEACV
eukprot:1147679-Pelagomonas_calceolata.AAC.2